MKTLQTRCRRQDRKPLMLMHEDAGNFPSLLTYSRFQKGSRRLKFDRIICDVPCSADGTFRKNSSQWQQWTVKEGMSLHKLQCRSLKRALMLTLLTLTQPFNIMRSNLNSIYL